MGIEGQEGFDRVDAKLAGLLVGLAPELELVGKSAAEGIIQTTLAGIGDGDQPFAPYSPAYQAQLDAVGGKARQVVDLRGVFYHADQQPKTYRSEAARAREREGRRGRTAVSFIAAANTDAAHRVAFGARTGTTRPSLGLTDPRSELSLDLISIEATDEKLSIIYKPRKNGYMIDHHNGTGNAPARPWFSLNKAAIRARALTMLRGLLDARAQRFNDER